jgi:hypothetical protein
MSGLRQSQWPILSQLALETTLEHLEGARAELQKD